MSWGTTVKTDIYLSHIAIRDIDDEIEDTKSILGNIEREISVMIGANVRDLVSDEDRKEGAIAEMVSYKIRNLFNDYREEVEKLYRLELVKDNIDKAIEG